MLYVKIKHVERGVYMKACGIITEYNPFHNGHIYHIKQARKLTGCDCLIAVMSGNFVQRGEPAIIDKWERTKACLHHGVDLVIELPYVFATQSADYFAKGAIQSLDLVDVDSIVFGSECNDIELLKNISQFSSNVSDQSKSYAKNFSDAISKLSSNDILGVAYIKALQNTTITPYTIKRTNGYHELNYHEQIASASAIRHAVNLNQNISHATVMAKDLSTTFAFKNYYPYLQTLLMTVSRSSLKDILLIDEGIEQLFKKNAELYDDFDDFLNACISKRYTKSRIQRCLIQILTQTKKEEVASLHKLQHVRVLGFNTIGKSYLSKLKKKENLILASRFNQIPVDYRQMELRATQAYAYPLAQSKRKEEIAKEWQSFIYIP